MSVLTFFSEFRQYASKLTSDVANLKDSVQSAPEALTKTQGLTVFVPFLKMAVIRRSFAVKDALAPMASRLNACDYNVTACKETHCGTGSAPKATMQQVWRLMFSGLLRFLFAWGFGLMLRIIADIPPFSDRSCCI